MATVTHISTCAHTHHTSVHVLTHTTACTSACLFGSNEANSMIARSSFHRSLTNHRSLPYLHPNSPSTTSHTHSPTPLPPHPSLTWPTTTPSISSSFFNLLYLSLLALSSSEGKRRKELSLTQPSNGASHIHGRDQSVW